jgi:molecular chaperone DnaK
VDEFKKDQGIDLSKDRQAVQRLTEAAEKAKIELSSAMETEINLPFITADATGPRHLLLKLTRAKFEQLTHDLIERTMAPVKQAIADAKITEKDLEEVILVGGSTRIPAVKELVKRLTAGKEPNQSVNPDEVVAIGAAIQAGVLTGEVKDVLLLDVTPLSLGVETLGGVMTKLIERNSTIPSRKTEIFSTAADNQPAVDIHVLQGERELARDNRTLGQFKLEGIAPGPRGTAQIEVTFDIDANGILNVTAKDLGSGKEQKITISGSTSLDKAEIDRMIRDAEQHAVEDRQRRELVEARNTADSLAYGVERAISDMGDRVPAHERARAESLIGDIRSAVKDESTSIDRLRQLTSDLQQVSHALASAAYGAQASAAGAGAGGGGGGTSGRGGADDDVIDADYTPK